MPETFHYTPNDYECEKASNGYLMSIVIIIVGLPLPIINLIATGMYYLGNRNGTFFVRWHSLQALLSQFFVAIVNSCGLTWTLSIIFGDLTITNYYIAYIISALIFNFIEFIMTLIAATQTRKGVHTYWFLFGPLTDLVCKPERAS